MENYLLLDILLDEAFEWKKLESKLRCNDPSTHHLPLLPFLHNPASSSKYICTFQQVGLGP